MGKLKILPQKSWHVYSKRNRDKVRQDEEQAGASNQIQHFEPKKNTIESRPQRLGKQPQPWYMERKEKSVSEAEKLAELLVGDPLIAMRAHDQRVEKRRKKLANIEAEARFISNDKHERRHRKKKKDNYKHQDKHHD
ncbi:hypothetical protein COEREDRAFT_86512 [Coemansia reversa NRRL 1564]|uniref:CBF1-interacting co-repressor CIR N-terminal domain-containing protein n=1 Tax=Coemansia reversa (strain ATCC 12441 / NRRL 1564) TaxID=763665 RepID=A0A2G5BDM0_COERN|nr:hypothetical protein COEREDRAFT_86512 [Coemansia reversa NRRL 1564]|eukprot:PIA17114.1 hypothetical protein COEREDRAFT_86512 [Coemansia reversa NRRL 1564]